MVETQRFWTSLNTPGLENSISKGLDTDLYFVYLNK
jgi:hypothetical protein